MKILLTKRQLSLKVKALARRIKADYNDRAPVFVGILKGSFVFMADLVREYGEHCEMDFMAVASYGNKRTGSGVVRLIKDINVNIKNRDVLIVEDIIDSGLTSNYVKQYLQLRKPNSIEFVSLLDKESSRKKDIDIKYVGFVIPDKFVVGYGLDYAERYRHLPYIAEFTDDELKKGKGGLK